MPIISAGVKVAFGLSMPGYPTGLLLGSRMSSRPRVSWLSPALASHQQLDAGIAARHQVDRKSIKKSKRPFENYFRSEYRCSPSPSRFTLRPGGRVSSYDAVKLMTDPRRNWSPFWGRVVGNVRIQKKRQDVLQPAPQQFGEDSLDQTIQRFLELRFQWDRGDDILAPSLVPPSLYSLTEHCLPYACDEQQQQQTVSDCVELDGGGAHSSAFRARGRRKCLLVPRGNLGSSGVETIPSIVLDAARGPLVSSPTELSLNLRWKATNREATSVSEVLRLQQCVGHVPVMGMTARSLLLLLKAHATAEVENPPLAVALAIAAAEHYHEYTPTECLELLRCLRRVAFVKGLTQLSHSQVNVVSLYRDSRHSQMFFAGYIGDAAPFLVERVWSRLPEHAQRLCRRRLFLDFIDLLALAVEMNGWRFPCNLPNPASSATYASKYLFLRYTLQLDEAMMTEYVRCVADATFSAPQTELYTNVGGQQQNSRQLIASRCDPDDSETLFTPLITWLCVSFLARVTAEAVGDVLRHTEISLKQHMKLAKDYQSAAARGKSKLQRLKAERDLQQFLDSIALVRPRHHVYQCIGRRHPRKMRLRVIPLEAFPAISRHTGLPFGSASRHAHLSAERRCGSFEHDDWTFEAVVARSALARKHIERAKDALDWAAMMLTNCAVIARHIPTPAKRLEACGPKHTFVFPAASHLPSSIDAASNRLAWCEALVRSRVQEDIDSLFLHIPWCELEEQLQPFLDSEGKTNGIESKEGTQRAGKVTTAGDGGTSLLDAYFPFDFLDNSGGTGDCRQVPRIEYDDAEHTKHPKTAQQDQNSLEALQVSIEKFQVTVAELIRAQEDYFLIL